ncbi:MAG TPA: methyltransferase domain-containing protein [Thermoplasmata archaeon]|nr:methyltransferase domain-containing protein [Thermoplasmata archaeon]
MGPTAGMPWKYTDEYYRKYTRQTWDESAEAYVGLLRNLEPFRSDLVADLAPQAGERVLDLGTGPGEPAMTIASLVGPGGHVTGVDLSEKMVAIAQRVAGARGLANVDFRPMDCTSLRLPDGYFHAAVSSFGFQIFTDPESAAKEARRVLLPGGRISASVWSTGDRVPFLHAIVGPMLEHAEPDETGYLPTPYETGGPGELAHFLESVGFRGARERRVEHRLQFRDADEYLRVLLNATPIGHSLREEPESVQESVLRENLRRWTSPSGIAIPGEVAIVTARS